MHKFLVAFFLFYCVSTSFSQDSCDIIEIRIPEDVEIIEKLNCDSSDLLFVSSLIWQDFSSKKYLEQNSLRHVNFFVYELGEDELVEVLESIKFSCDSFFYNGYENDNIYLDLNQKISSIELIVSSTKSWRKISFSGQSEFDVLHLRGHLKITKKLLKELRQVNDLKVLKIHKTSCRYKLSSKFLRKVDLPYHIEFVD